MSVPLTWTRAVQPARFKHLEQAVLLDIQQAENDRILSCIYGRDELMARFIALIIELMGRHSNVILVNGQDRIIDLP